MHAQQVTIEMRPVAAPIRVKSLGICYGRFLVLFEEWNGGSSQRRIRCARTHVFSAVPNSQSHKFLFQSSPAMEGPAILLIPSQKVRALEYGIS